jgi:hypothetical protein
MPTLVASDKLYANAVNPQWVRLLDVLQMNVAFAHCEGAVDSTSTVDRRPSA